MSGLWNLIRIASPGSTCSRMKATVNDAHSTSTACRTRLIRYRDMRSPGSVFRQPNGIETRPSHRLERDVLDIRRAGEHLRLLENRNVVGLVDQVVLHLTGIGQPLGAVG